MAKTIFNTTEKSNFILNMRKSTIRRMVLTVLCAVPIIMSVCLLPEYLDIGTFALASLGISICGIASVIVFAIILARQMVPKKQLPLILLLLAMSALAAVSMAGAFDFDIAFSGLAGRYEGFLAIICYAGIFLLGMQLTASMNYVRIMDCIVIAGAFQCVMGAFQMIPLMKFNPYYNTLIPLTDILDGKETYLPYGTLGSPILFAAFMCLTMAVSLCGACYDSSKARRVIYSICTAVFIVMAAFTRAMIGALGITAVLVMLLITELIRMKKGAGKTSHTTHPLLLIIIFAILFAAAQIIGLSKTIFYDGGIIWQDSSHHLFVTGTHYPALSSFNAAKITEVYSFLWQNTVEGIKKYSLWLTGSGPDCLYFTQFRTTSIITSENDSFDRCYNEYLYILATRGIPALVVYLGILATVVTRSVRNFKDFLRNDNRWIYSLLLCVSVMFVIINMFYNSVPSVSAVFWLLLGIAARRNPESASHPLEQK